MFYFYVDIMHCFKLKQQKQDTTILKGRSVYCIPDPYCYITLLLCLQINFSGGNCTSMSSFSRNALPPRKGIIFTLTCYSWHFALEQYTLLAWVVIHTWDDCANFFISYS